MPEPHDFTLDPGQSHRFTRSHAAGEADLHVTWLPVTVGPLSMTVADGNGRIIGNASGSDGAAGLTPVHNMPRGQYTATVTNNGVQTASCRG